MPTIVILMVKIAEMKVNISFLITNKKKLKTIK